MVDQVIALMTSGSPMVAFAIYLIWSNSRSEKRLDEVNNKFMERVDKMVSENKTEIEGLRDRYEGREDEQRERWQTVVKQVQSDRDAMERDLLRSTQQTRETVDKLATAIEQFGLTVSGINQNLALLTERISTADNKIDRLIDRS